MIICLYFYMISNIPIIIQIIHINGFNYLFLSNNIHEFAHYYMASNIPMQ